MSRIRWPYADGQAVGIGVVPPDSERAIEWIRVALCRRPGRRHREEAYADGYAVGIDGNYFF